MKRYQKLAEWLSQQIEQGVLTLGQRLPSIRALSRQHQVSIATVQRALEVLESRDLVEARPRSGYYVRQSATEPVELELPLMPLIPKSVQVHARASEIFHQCDQPTVINLGTSYPAADYFPNATLAKMGRDLLRRRIHDITAVHFSAGLPALRRALAQQLNQRGCLLREQDLIVTNGCLEALSICLRAVARPGDTIAVESPGFVGLLQLIESMGYQALEIPCHPQTGISLEALQLALEQWPIKAVAIVPTFSNPSGSCMPIENRQRLVRLLAEHQVPLIEDDLLGELSFDGRLYPPCKAFDEKGLVLYCSSASKTIASGFRTGWIAPGAYYHEVEYFKTFSNISAPNFQQMVLAEFLKSGQYARHIRRLQLRLGQNMSRMLALVKRYFPTGTRVSHPRGGCVLWVALPEGIETEQLFSRAIERGVAFIPGDLMSASGKFKNYLRLNCAVGEDVDLEGALRALSSLFSKANG